MGLLPRAEEKAHPGLNTIDDMEDAPLRSADESYSGTHAFVMLFYRTGAGGWRIEVCPEPNADAVESVPIESGKNRWVAAVEFAVEHELPLLSYSKEWVGMSPGADTT